MEEGVIRRPEGSVGGRVDASDAGDIE